MPRAGMKGEIGSDAGKLSSIASSSRSLWWRLPDAKARCPIEATGLAPQIAAYEDTRGYIALVLRGLFQQPRRPGREVDEVQPRLLVGLRRLGKLGPGMPGRMEGFAVHVASLPMAHYGTMNPPEGVGKGLIRCSGNAASDAGRVRARRLRGRAVDVVPAAVGFVLHE